MTKPRLVTLITSVALIVAPEAKPQASIHSPSAEQTTGKADSGEGLRQFLIALLAAARTNNTRHVAELIEKTAIPVTKDWPAEIDGGNQGEGSVVAYRANLKQEEEAMQRKFAQFAKQSGIFVVQKVDNKVGPEQRLDWEILKVMQTHGEIFSAEWRPSAADSKKGEATSYLLGYFTRLWAKDTWMNLGLPVQSNQQLLHSLPMKICQSGPSPECATQPRSIYAPDPEYTELARRKKIERTVRLEVTIGEDGQVHDITVVKFSGYDLDEQSVKAVNQWKFEPAVNRGSPVPVRTRVEVGFRLY